MILALVGALLVGLTLGLLGSGGAIFCVPTLVYLLGHGEKQAITESMAIVGVIAFAGAVRCYRNGESDLKVAALYAVPGLAGSFVGAAVSGWFTGAQQLAMLALLMATVAALMFREPSPAQESGPTPPIWSAPLQGFGIGILTGLLGVGGGFMIVTSLVLMRRMEMPLAVGTSLAVIAANCAAGLAKHLASALHPPDWPVVGMFSIVGIVGSMGGIHLGGKLDRTLLRRVFAGFLVALAAFIIIRELPKLSHPPDHPYTTTRKTTS